MTDYGRLMVRVDKYLEGDLVSSAVPVRVRRSGAVSASAQRVVTLAAPATFKDEWEVRSLPPGLYDVEAVLPSGELLSQEVTLGAGTDVRVVLRGEHSPNEWRSWAHFGGARDASTTAKASRPMLEGRQMAPPPDVSYALGQHARCDGVRIDVASWQGWFECLEMRWHAKTAGSAEAPLLDMTSPPPSLQVAIQGGRPGEPVRLSVSGHGYPASAMVGMERAFLSVSSARGFRVVSLPWPWQRAYDSQIGDDFFHVLVSETESDLLCETVLRDDHLGGLLAYLNAGRMGLAGELLDAAKGALFAKYDNPLGAAAGGYVLLSTAESDALKAWPDWLSNLADNFPFLPDGAILRARWLLDRGGKTELDEAAALLLDAYRRGIPFFTTGSVWLAEGLERIARDFPWAQEALPIVRTVGRSMDLHRGFTSFSLPPFVEQGGGRNASTHFRKPAASEGGWDEKEEARAQAGAFA